MRLRIVWCSAGRAWGRPTPGLLLARLALLRHLPRHRLPIGIQVRVQRLVHALSQRRRPDVLVCIGSGCWCRDFGDRRCLDDHFAVL